MKAGLILHGKGVMVITVIVNVKNQKIMRTKFKLQEGEKSVSQGKNELSITGTGKQAYLWIGGNGCYGTISGKKTLEMLAKNILKAIKVNS